MDPLSIDELYGHLLAHEMRIEQQLLSIDLAQPYANIISLLGLPCLEAEVTVVVAHHLPTVDNNTIVVVVLPPSTEGLAPNSPMTLPLHHGLQVKFVASGHTALRCYRRQDSASPSEFQYNPQAYYSSPTLPTEDN